MKSYSMHDSNPAKKSYEELIAKHKKEREGTNKKVNSIESTFNDSLDDLDDISVDDTLTPIQKKSKSKNENQDGITLIDEDGDGYADYIVDSKGERLEIKNAMWESKGKRTKYQEQHSLPSWQKSAVRMNVKDWLMFLIVCLVPILNVLVFVYNGYFSNTAPDEKKNYCRANIILVFLCLCAIGTMAVLMPDFRQMLLNLMNRLL